MRFFLFLFAGSQELLGGAVDVNGTMVPRNRKLQRVGAQPNLVSYARALNKEAIDAKAITPDNVTSEWL